MIPTKTTCPLGGTCEKIVDGHIERCAWYTELEGVNPQTGEKQPPRSMCAMAWIPILLIDNTAKTSGMSEGIQSLGNAINGFNPIQLLMRDEKEING